MTKTRIGILAVTVIAALAVALWWFTPWKLVVDEAVNQAVPTSRPRARRAGGARQRRARLDKHQPRSVLLLELPDGQRSLRLEDLNTSNGPLLKVFLTDAAVLPGSDGWHVFDDGRYLDLGPLAGNLGSSNYPISPGADLIGLHSVSIWCDRFDVSFGAAEPAPSGAT